MKLKEFREMFKGHKIIIRDMNGKNISYKPKIISDLFDVIGSEHRPDKTIVVDVAYHD